MTDSISKIEIITRKSNFDELKTALNEIGIMGMTVTQVLGCGTQKGDIQYYRGVPMELKLLPKIKIEIIVCEVPVQKVIDVATKILRTGEIGDGKIFVYDVKDVVKIRTGATGKEALINE
ncbi:MAG: P-II family nitrogen regulator [Clostridium butyricum]|jgi:nitrogen regulatory protein PII|uniref:P-II family nitrogen regulator n=1 Tax=Clostridium butyricum TaxID=1492 RepID=A0A6L9EP81_CLOBU|nr:P-II family nitrogen regulator [Clostridium butyricum]MDU5724267.1 P-II family nitrogen regulator [Clostridium butyricum]MDU5821985.1 P-II family nitrogen regulator [Clostridium butyricum]NAS17805.1 P-II family nitrogen regulator [Clostridium butyricum]